MRITERDFAPETLEVLENDNNEKEFGMDKRKREPLFGLCGNSNPRFKIIFWRSYGDLRGK